MIKEDIIRDITIKLKIDRDKARELVEDIISEIKSCLQRKETVLISSFGSFKVNYKKPRLGRNPRTKESYKISERNVVTFCSSKVLRKAINEEYQDS